MVKNILFFILKSNNLFFSSLQKTPEDRPSATSLLEHPWLEKFKDDTSVPQWLQQMIQIDTTQN